MRLLSTLEELQNTLSEIRQKELLPCALIPTMGALHEGHLSLIKVAYAAGARSVLLSIFVNPTQFNQSSDLAKYPRNLDADLQKLSGSGVTAVFAPANPEQIYGANFQTWVSNDELSKLWEGASRPGHFRGVATIVTKLLNLFQAELAIFGEKDFQQLRIVETLVQDLNLRTRIIRAPISRDPDGLARSSRNSRLSDEGRRVATAISRGLFIARDAFKGGQRDVRFLCSIVKDTLSGERGISVDYASVVDEDTLKEVSVISNAPHRMLVAAEIEGVRLIDNIALVS